MKGSEVDECLLSWANRSFVISEEEDSNFEAVVVVVTVEETNGGEATLEVFEWAWP